MIRIAFVVHSMRSGGIERSVARIILGLDRELFQPIVICLDRTGPADAWLPSDVPVVEIKKRPGNDISAIGRLSRVLKKHQIGLVQSHNWGTLLETAVARKLAGVTKHIHAERGTVLGTINKKGIKHWIRGLAMRSALWSVDKTMSNALAVAERVESACGYRAGRITIIPNGVPSPTKPGRQTEGQQIRKSLGIGKESILVGTVGRLHRVKGFDVLIEAFEIAGNACADIHLVIVGDGDQKEALNQIAKDRGISNRIHLVGHQQSVSNWMSAMDIYVNSSRSEGMSQSIVEAMAVGLPIIATDAGDARRMIAREKETCGVICPINDSKAIAAAIEEFSASESLRDDLSKVAIRVHKNHYSETTFHDRIEAFYLATMRSEAGESRLEKQR